MPSTAISKPRCCLLRNMIDSIYINIGVQRGKYGENFVVVSCDKHFLDLIKTKYAAITIVL